MTPAPAAAKEATTHGAARLRSRARGDRGQRAPWPEGEAEAAMPWRLEEPMGRTQLDIYELASLVTSLSPTPL
jgi:hypothetical protein